MKDGELQKLEEGGIYYRRSKEHEKNFGAGKITVSQGIKKF